MICHFLLNHQRNGSNLIIMKKVGYDDYIFDCEEEMSTKSLKHLNDMKSLNTERKASNLKPLKSQEKDC
jgi:hypothetical protein